MKKTVLALLIDPTPLARAVISRAFDPTDFEVFWTTNLSEAVETSTRHHVDLMLLDLSQPSHTGRGTFERLTALNRGAPVIILTEQKSAYEEAVADRAGAVLQKPFSVAACVQTINTLLGKASSGAAPPPNHGAGVRDVTTKSDDFREMLYQRYSTPFEAGTSYRQWGINE
jgi:DNA-binding response OmpR family regulator